MGKHRLKDVDCFISRGGGETFFVDPAGIKVVDGWNKRRDFSGEEELMGVIKNLQVPPILVRKTPENTLELVDGERRLRATLRLIKEGCDIPGIRVEVAPKDTNDIDLCFRAIALNGGKPLLPIEEANFFLQLENWGVTRNDIAKKCGKALSTVRNRLELVKAIPSVQEAVANKQITIKQASKIVEKSGGKVDAQVEELELEKKKPRTRTKKPTIVAFSENDLCEGVGCPRLRAKLAHKAECYYSNNTCIFTALELLEWFSKDGFKIKKEV